MTDSMKFGPEWLRNLSSEGSTTGAPKCQLAEHRYGREEMLALFDRNVRAPDPIVKLQGLYVEKTQTPMALLTMTDEENRQWHKGINSDAVLRLVGKSSLVGPPGGGLRGRGGSVDRGRGRARGPGGFPYSRGLSYEEQSDGVKESVVPERGFTRGIRSYDRAQGLERNWIERNDGDPGDWNGSTSPRKEFSTSKDFSGGGRNNNENWRRHRGTTDDEEGWRKSEKWGRSNSWRDENSSGEGGPLSKSSSRTSSWGRGWADEGLRGRSHDEDSISMKRSNFVDEVPEWATENPSESGGSFDASGAFHGGNYSDEEEDSGSRNARNRLSDDLDLRNKSKSPPRGKKSSRNDCNDYDDECEDANSSPKDRKLSRSQTAGCLSEPSKVTSHSLSKTQRSSNAKTEPPELSNSAKRTESQNFDRIRVQHQNFVDKNGTNKEVSDDGEVNDMPKKPEVIEPNCISEDVSKSETSEVTKSGVSNVKEKNSVFQKENLNNSAINSGLRIPEEEMDRGGPVNRQGSEEDMERMAEVVKDTIVKLFEDEEKPPVSVESDKWYYQDPQGVVQGPFRSTEMLEWFMNDYFPLSLLVRREQDELYVRLGYLMILCNNIPFLPGVDLPPLKADAKLLQQLPTPAQPRPNGLYLTDFLLPDYIQFQQKPFYVSLNLAYKLSQSEMWNTLSPVQKTSLLRQTLAMAQQPPLPIDQLAQIVKNPLAQLITQMQQQNKLPMPEIRDPKSLDPIRQSLQQMNVMPPAQPPLVAQLNPGGVVMNHHLNPPHLNTILTNTGMNPMPPLGVEEPKVEDPIQSLLRQLGNQQNMMPPHTPAPTDSLWGAPGRVPHWVPPNQPVAPAGMLPLREIKTEQQILAEQQLRLEEERRQEEMRKRKEEEEEQAKRQKELEEKIKAEEKRKAEEEREEVKKLMMKQLEEKKLRIQQEKEKKKAEELKKKQQQEEALKKKQEMAKKMQEAQKKKEEKERKKEEEREKKRLEEEKKKQENERKKKEKEEEQQRLKKKQEEEEEAARKQEQLKRPMDALKKMQEQQMEPFKRPLPWSQPAVTPTGTSLSDIQKMQEKEKKQQLLREQQAAQQLAQQKEIQRENEARSNGLNLKWAEQMPKTNPNVKSLAEIQAEEQLQLAKQLEKERMERAQQQKEASVTTNAGIWGNASQSLTWTNSTAPWAAPPVQNNPPPGFWDVVAPNSTKSKTKTPSSPVKGKAQPAPVQKSGSNTGANQKGSKPKSKKEEAAVMKLFERLGDEFTSWCSASLQSIQSDVDIPTFVSFLRDIESPYEVTDYVKCYLGDGKEAQEFAKQFLERRSRWISAQKANAGDDDRSASFQSVNSGSQYQANVAQEFQEVKSKGKKSKKGKMLKVDNRILGFSVTAAPDRINVGDRDYVNHNL